MMARSEGYVAALVSLGANPPLAAKVIAREVSDVTSDIWEPIVRRLFAELSLARRYIDDPDGQASIREALHMAKEALGREETS
jgi:hypothetical protein